MKEAWLTEDSFWQPAGWYTKFLVMPDMEKEVLSGQIIYKVWIAANDNKVYYYEISWSGWKITKSTITENFTIDKKSGADNNLTYTISPEDKNSSKYTINLNELWMDNIYEFKDKIYLEIEYEWEKVLEWSIIDKNSRYNLWKLTNDDLDELYNFESNHEIINAGNITWWDILLSTLKENVIYEYTIPKWSYCEANVINDLWTDCIIYEKDGEYSKDDDGTISYSRTPMLELLYPRWYPGQRWGCSWTDWHKYYILYKKASIEDLFKTIPSYKILNLDKYEIWDKLTRNTGRDYDKEYLYNNTDENLTFFITSFVPKDRWIDDMVITVPPKRLLFVSDSVDTVILTKKWTESKKITKDNIIDLVISDRELDLDSIDKNSIKIRRFIDTTNNKKIYEVSMRDTRENQLYISYVDIENLYIMLEEKTMFNLISKESWLSFKEINDWIINYWLDNNNINNFMCSVQSNWFTYNFTVDVNEKKVISQDIMDFNKNLVIYWPDNVIYPKEKIEVDDGILYLTNLKENVIYEYTKTNIWWIQPYNNLWTPVTVYIKVIEPDWHYNDEFSSDILNPNGSIARWSVKNIHWYVLYRKEYSDSQNNSEVKTINDSHNTGGTPDFHIYETTFTENTDDSLPTKNEKYNRAYNTWGEFIKLTDAEIKEYYYDTCSCPIWYSYAPEWVTYGEPWCEAKICEDDSNCMTYITSFSNKCRQTPDIEEISSWIPTGSKNVENYYQQNCSCPIWFRYVEKSDDTYADSCDREYCVDNECKEKKTRHIWVKDLCNK